MSKRRTRENTARNRKNLNDNYNQYYSNSSEAYEVEYDYEDNTEEVRTTKRKVKKVIRKKKKIGERYRYDTENKVKLSLTTYLIVIVIFSGLISFLSLNAQKSYLILSIEELQDNLKAKQEEVDEIKVSVAEGYDLREIEKIASTRLGMSKPQPHQIINITINKSDTISHGDATINTQTKENTNILGRISTFFK